MNIAFKTRHYACAKTREDGNNLSNTSPLRETLRAATDVSLKGGRKSVQPHRSAKWEGAMARPVWQWRVLRRFMRFVPGVVTVAAVGLLLGVAERVEAQQPATIRIGYVPVITQLPTFTAIDKGYFKQAGFDVQLKTVPGGAATLEALAGGSVDVAANTNIISLFQAIEQGYDLVILAGDTGIAHSLPDVAVNMVRKDLGIMTIKDLEGKRFGVPNLKNINWLYDMEYLRRNGVDTSKITWLEIGVPQEPAALLTRQVDIETTVEPFSTVLSQSGEAMPLYSEFVEIAPGGLLSVWSTTRAWYEAHRNEAARLVEVIERGIAYNQAHQQEARVRLAKYTRIDPALAGKVTWPVWKPALSRSDLQVPMDLAIKYGLLKKPLPLDKIVVQTAAGR